MTSRPPLQGPMGRWSERRAEADARRAQQIADYNDSVKADIARQRLALREEAERLAQAEAEARAAEALKLRVSCPCCSGNVNGVLATTAEWILRVVAAYGDEPRRPDDWNLRRLHMIAVGADDGHLILPRGLHYPKPVAKIDTATETVAEPAKITPKSEPVIQSKPPRRKPTAAEIYAAGDDGVAELDD